MILLNMLLGQSAFDLIVIIFRSLEGKMTADMRVDEKCWEYLGASIAFSSQEWIGQMKWKSWAVGIWNRRPKDSCLIQIKLFY